MKENEQQKSSLFFPILKKKKTTLILLTISLLQLAIFLRNLHKYFRVQDKRAFLCKYWKWKMLRWWCFGDLLSDNTYNDISGIKL